MEKVDMTEINKMKRPYIAPTTRWVWIGLDKKIAQANLGGQGAGSQFGGGVDDDDVFVREEGDIDEGMWTSDAGWASSGGVWDNAW